MRQDIQAGLQGPFNSNGSKPSLPGDWLTLTDISKRARPSVRPADIQPHMVEAAHQLATMQLWIDSGGERLSNGEL